MSPGWGSLPETLWRRLPREITYTHTLMHMDKVTTYTHTQFCPYNDVLVHTIIICACAQHDNCKTEFYKSSSFGPFVGQKLKV